MAILLFAILAFLAMRLAIPRLKPTSNLKLALLSVPCAVTGWLLFSLATNLVWRAH